MIYISTLAGRQNDFILGSQQTVTYSKTIIETLEKGAEMFKINHKRSRTTSSITSFWCFNF